MSVLTKKYKNRKCRSIAFQNDGILKGGNCDKYNVSGWDTRYKQIERKLFSNSAGPHTKSV